MGELKDRRARKKAQTRGQIRAVAHALFAERGFDAVTIADIANDADVAVQTVFNHFATKEELFFDGRAEWVGAAARAVRARAAEVPPLTALREHLVEAIRGYLHSLDDPEMQSVVATIEASPALSAHERELHHINVRQLSEALMEAQTDEPAGGVAAANSRVSAALTAAIWSAAIRGLIIEHRSEISRDGASSELGVAVQLLGEHVLAQFEDNLALMPGTASAREASAPGVTGWPDSARRVV